MRHAAGQAARQTGRLLHALAQLALALVVVAAVVLGGIGWRLSRAPLPLPWLAQVLAGAVNANAPVHIRLGSAALAWEGFRGGLDRPLDIRLADVSVSDADGRPIATLPRAAVSLAPGWLLLGRIVPRAIEADGAWLRVLRAADGGVGLDLGSRAETADRSDPAPVVADLPHILAELSQPPHTTHAAGRPARWSELRRVRVRDAAITVADRTLGVTWRVPNLDIDLERSAAGGIAGQATARLAVDDQSATLAARATLEPGGGRTQLAASLSEITPSALAQAVPRAVALAAVDAPVTLSGRAALGSDLTLIDFTAEAVVGAGTLHVAQGTAPLLSARVAVAGTPAHATVTLPELVTAPRPDGPHTTISGHADLSRGDGQIAASVTLDLDQAAFADLPVLWPAGLGGPDARPWIVGNITAGTAHNLHTDLTLTAAADLSHAKITGLAGGGDGTDLTVRWLPKAPPLLHADAHLIFVSPERIDIVATAGQEPVGHDTITLHGGKVVLTGLGGADQFADIDADLSGPVPAGLALLSHPPIKLLDRSPIKLADSAGQFAGHLTIAHLKLRDDITMDDLAIRTNVKLSGLRLAGIAAGRDLDRGTLDLQATADEMHVAGAASLGGIPAQLTLDMDFRRGPPEQVQQSVTLSGTLDAAQLAGLGLDAGSALRGGAMVAAKLQMRRNQHGEASIDADLAGMDIALDAFDWRKPQGQAARLAAHLLLDRDQLYAVDTLTAEGDGLHVAGSAVFADGRPDRVFVDRLALGTDTDAHGTLRLPQSAGAPYVVALDGRSLNIAGALKRDTAPGPKPAAKPGPPYRIAARFDRVLLGPGREVSAVTATAENDGSVLRQLDLSGMTAGSQPFRLAIASDAHGRALTGSAADAGALLRAFDVIATMQGGRLALSGMYDDSRPSHPLSGRAEIDDFRIRHAPALAKLLQAMTLYGMFDLLQGPGLGFSRLEAPFRFDGTTLELMRARAFNSSLGMTAKGSVDLAAQSVDMQGTIVPAYFFNSLLGDLPLIGKLFSPERGGGLFAATYAVHGPIDDPHVSVNPLAALTPGFLRGVFGLLDQPTGK